MKTFLITYHFTSTKADGADYTRTLEVKARACSDSTARLEGFQAFGHRFNDNCFDWQIREAR